MSVAVTTTCSIAELVAPTTRPRIVPRSDCARSRPSLRQTQASVVQARTRCREVIAKALAYPVPAPNETHKCVSMGYHDRVRQALPRWCLQFEPPRLRYYRVRPLRCCLGGALAAPAVGGLRAGCA